MTIRMGSESLHFAARPSLTLRGGIDMLFRCPNAAAHDQQVGKLSMGERVRLVGRYRMAELVRLVMVGGTGAVPAFVRGGSGSGSAIRPPVAQDCGEPFGERVRLDGAQRNDNGRELIGVEQYVDLAWHDFWQV